jgi:hypothetical protein
VNCLILTAPFKENQLYNLYFSWYRFSENYEKKLISLRLSGQTLRRLQEMYHAKVETTATLEALVIEIIRCRYNF